MRDMTETPSTPAGWYPDPENPGAQRYWDGNLWAAPVAAPAPPVPVVPAKKRSKAGIALLVVGVLILATVGISIAASAGKGGADALVGGATTSPTTRASDESSTSSTTPPPPAAYVPKPADFTVKIKTRKKECFGSAGCIVTYRIVPAYSGLPFQGSYDVTYRVSGDESGPSVNTFTIDEDGQASFDSEETADTPSTHTVLKAKVTEVSPS